MTVPVIRQPPGRAAAAGGERREQYARRQQGRRPLGEGEDVDEGPCDMRIDGRGTQHPVGIGIPKA
ncbi:hypothetical protein, partial [Streptomyces sp. Wh19]|uniref:hypothetical protein n=1 Tax=Streptomyces sp. Wh19 TaxID=3076629 RepID=UPI0029589555